MTRHLGLSAVIILVGSKGLQTAVANGDTRSISMHHTHRGDDVTVTFKRNGRYDADGLKKLNHFLRDWRTDDQVEMDPQLFDAVWEVSREFGSDKVIHIISSYRSPKTNAMLRSRSNGVARSSLHMQGKAMDFFIPGVSLDQIRAAGLRLQRGGVGFYPTSGSPFVHMDVGNVRHWPRMTRDQLVRVFPNQRTVHVPTDGHPLAGYDLAMADIQKRGGSPSAVSLAARGDTKPNVFARMFGFGKQKDEEEEADKTPAAPAQVAARTPSVRTNTYTPGNTPKPDAETPAQTAANIPLPKGRPANVQNVQVASVQPVSAERPAAPIKPSAFRALVAVTPNDIIRSRGYWQGLPETPAEASAARRRPVDIASSAPGAVTTASIGPFAMPEGYKPKSNEYTLAYASAQPEPRQEQAKPVPSIPRHAAITANTTVATKATAAEPSRVQSLVDSATTQTSMPTDRLDTPWLRATMMTPSVESFMNTTLLGAQDFISLRSFMAKPATAVLMGFSTDPHHGMSHTAFSGSAVNFLATASFGQRTAALR